MPELPEAEVAALQLRKNIVGATVGGSWVGRPDIVRAGLPSLPWYHGSRINAIERRGKAVVIALWRDGETRFLVAELGMTGLLLLSSVDVRLPQHIHFILKLEGASRSELRYWNPRRFGRIYLFNSEQLQDYSDRRFGHDPLVITIEEFQTVVTSTRSRLKSLLMRQQRLAGIGNIYANEILFRAGLHPNKAADRLRRTEIRRLYHAMRDVLTSAIQSGGSSVRDFFAPDGTAGTYKLQHRVYAKAGLPCPNHCGGTIRRLAQERSSFYCLICQPRPRRR